MKVSANSTVTIPRYVLIARDLLLSYVVALTCAIVVACRFWDVAPRWVVVVPTLTLIAALVRRLPTLIRQWNLAASPSELTTRFPSLPYIGPIIGLVCGAQSCILVTYGTEADVLVVGSAMMIASVIGGLALSSRPQASLWITVGSGLPIVGAAIVTGNPAAVWLVGLNGATIGFTLALAKRQKGQVDLMGIALADAQRAHDADAARRAAEAANVMKSTFLANMSHEIRTPLNGVIGMAQVMSAQDLTDEHREMVDTIKDSGDVLMAILNDVLDISKIEAGKLEVSPVSGDLRHSLRRVQKLFTANAEEKDIELRLNVSPDLPASLRFDPVRVRQVCSNLVSNAVKFTDCGSVSVDVSWRCEGDDTGQVAVAVTDTGIGIAEQAVARLFSAFEQADSTTTRRFGGTGLGLAISQRLARMMGGDIRVESEPNEGSTFTFTFAAEAQSDTGAADTHRPCPSNEAVVMRGMKSLLVDDNIVNRQVAALLLSTMGVETVLACDGAEALEKLEAEPFDFVLLDIHMPVMDGPRTIAEIRGRQTAWKNVPVIALTADAMSGDRERYIRMGMDGYVAKPIVHAELEMEIKRVMDRRRQMSQSPSVEAA